MNAEPSAAADAQDCTGTATTHAPPDRTAPHRVGLFNVVEGAVNPHLPAIHRVAGGEHCDQKNPMPTEPPIHTIGHVVIVIPACNEAATIGACLESIDAARHELPASVSTSVVVAADSCTDATETIALTALARHTRDQVLRLNVRSAGAARRIGTDAALANLEAVDERVWVANTDADTTVDVDWLVAHTRLAESGVVGVAGMVDLCGPGVVDHGLQDRFETTYTASADGTHPHVHGANLGFRADAYRTVGGWNPLVTGEDHDLWIRLKKHGAVVSTTELCVHTSARTTGRAPDGFASDLRLLTAVESTVA